MRLKKLIKKINKENTPPGGWRLKDKVSSLVSNTLNGVECDHDTHRQATSSKPSSSQAP
jgi:hypothetical protein